MIFVINFSILNEGGGAILNSYKKLLIKFYHLFEILSKN